MNKPLLCLAIALGTMVCAPIAFASPKCIEALATGSQLKDASISFDKPKNLPGKLEQWLVIASHPSKAEIEVLSAALSTCFTKAYGKPRQIGERVAWVAQPNGGKLWNICSRSRDGTIVKLGGESKQKAHYTLTVQCLINLPESPEDSQSLWDDD